MRFSRTLFSAVSVSLVLSALAAETPLKVDPKEIPRFPAVEPKDALGTFQVRPGFHV
jgi:hypothetical protein